MKIGNQLFSTYIAYVYMLHIEYETQDKGSVLYTMAIQQNFIKQKYCEKASHGFVFFLNMPSIYNGMVMKNMKKKNTTNMYSNFVIT